MRIGLIEENKVETIIIAVPPESKRTIREIIEICKEAPAKIQMIPACASNMDAVDNKVRDINYENIKEEMALDCGDCKLFPQKLHEGY